MLDSIAKGIFIAGCILATIALVALGLWAHQSGSWQGLGPIVVLLGIAVIGGVLGVLTILAAIFKGGDYFAKGIDSKISQRREPESDAARPRKTKSLPDSIATGIIRTGYILAAIALVVLVFRTYQSEMWQGPEVLIPILIGMAGIGACLTIFFVLAAIFKAGGYVAREIDYEIERKKRRHREQDQKADDKTPAD
jgi:MFS family permease